jgi:hypothetical protein
MADPTNYYDRPYDMVLNAWNQMENRTNQALATANAVMAELSNYHIEVGSVAPPTAPVIDINPPVLDVPTASVVSPARLDALVTTVENIPAYVEPAWEDGSQWVIPIDDITVPDFASYTSPTIEALRNRLQAMLMGGTGLPPAVESALFERARSRESLAALEATQNAFDTFAGRGFTLPNGVLVAQINAINENNQLKAGAINRDLLVQAAQMEVDNLRAAVQHGISLEQALISLFQTIEGLTLDAVKLRANLKVENLNARLSALKAATDKFSALSQSARSKVETLTQVAGDKLRAMGTVIQAETSRYQAETSFNAQKGELKMRGQEAQTRMTIAEYEILVKEFDMAQTRLIEQAKIIQGSVEAAGQMAAQLAAGYGAAMHASASMSGSAGISSSASVSESHNYDETTV